MAHEFQNFTHLLASLLLIMVPAFDVRVDAEGAILYVAAKGNDAWSGKLQEPNAGRTDGPFATLQRARDELRRMRQLGTLPERGCTVEVCGGSYRVERPLELTADDSGTADTPITYRAEPGAEVRLVGGRRVSNFVPVTDTAALARLDQTARGHVVQADLKALGILDYGKQDWYDSHALAGLELFSLDRPMTLARWPNQGEINHS